MIRALLYNELKLQLRQKTEWVTLVLFFLLVLVLLPFAIGPEPELLRRIAPGLIWLAAVLMNLLGLERLFVQDAKDGTLDLVLLSPMPLPLTVTIKLMAHGIVLLSALMAMLPLAMLILDLNTNVAPVLALSLLLGVPVLVLLGGIMAAVTLSVRRGAAMLTLLLVPFYIPVLIFAISATDAAALGTSPSPHLLLLAALLIITAPAAPFLISNSLKAGQG